MPKDFRACRKIRTPFSYHAFRKPLIELLKSVPVLKARGNRPLQLTFEDQLDALILFGNIGVRVNFSWFVKE